jgi:hypothetical protein
MAITKETQIGKIEVVGEFKAVQVAMDTLIKEDGKVISQTRHRHVLMPDSDITKESQEVKDVCNTVWTPEVRSAYEAFKIEQANRFKAI